MPKGKKEGEINTGISRKITEEEEEDDKEIERIQMRKMILDKEN